MTVRTNCFTNLERLGRWTGGTEPLKKGESPQGGFTPIPAGSLGASTADPTSILVMVHGWAPGYWKNVDQAGGNIQWWSDGMGNSKGVWPSAWAWVPSTTRHPALPVTKTGVFQEFQKHDAKNIVLGYSWTDDSASGGSVIDLLEVDQSEANTNINGLRLASALEEAIAEEFWTGSGNSLHLIGHSHGAKVVTVATLALQERGRKVDHLTLLDSPENELPLVGNGANLAGFYLAQLDIEGEDGTGKTFVENYVSELGVGFEGAPILENLVQVMLDPAKVDGFLELGENHSYSAFWYGGAAAGAGQENLPPIGLDWPPPPTDAQKNVLNQDWPEGVTERQQWILTSGAPTKQVREFDTGAQRISNRGTSGNVTFSRDQVLTFRADTGTGVISSVFEGGYRTVRHQYGLAFDVEWSHPADGGYVVVAVQSPELREQEVILVMDGKSMPEGKNPISWNADISSFLRPVKFFIYYIPVAGNSEGVLTVSNFQRVISRCRIHCP